MKITFNEIGAIIKTITNDEPLRQGNVGNTLKVYFQGEVNSNYIATLTFSKSNEEIINDIAMLPNALNSDEFDYTFKDSWFFDTDGETTITIYLKDGAGNVIASGQIKFNIEKTDYSTITNITPEQLDNLEALIATKVGVGSTSQIVDELSEIGTLNVVYYLKSSIDENYKLYVWTGKEYIYMGSTYAKFDAYIDKDAFNDEVNQRKENDSNLQNQINNKISISQKAQPNGVATLNSDGLIDNSQLPATMDEIISYDDVSAFPLTGQNNIIYYARDTKLTYRWDGTEYVSIPTGVALGETSSTAYPGDQGAKNDRDINNITYSNFIGNYEFGNITISTSGWSYSDDTSRVRTSEGYTIHLCPGDIIELSNQDLTRMYLGWKKADNTYAFQGWTSSNYIVQEEGDYVILLSYIPESEISNVNDIVERIKILRKKYNIESIQSTLDDLTIDSIIKNKIVKDYNTRFKTNEVLYLDYDVLVEFKNNCDIALRLYDNFNYENKVDLGWYVNSLNSARTIPINSFIIPKNTYFDLYFKNKDGSNIILTDLLQSITFTKMVYDTDIKYNFFSSDKIKSINHRGYNIIAPENTLSAFRLSKEMGFNIVECDIRKTKDNVIVLLHDATIDRTSNGTGAIAELTYEEVLQYDFGSWKNAKYAGEKIPTLEEFIILCRELNLHAYIEINSINNDDLDNVIEIISNYNMIDNVTFISYAQINTSYLIYKNPKFRNGIVFYEDYAFADRQKELYYHILGKKRTNNEVIIDINYRNPYLEDYINFAKKYGIKIELWTVNNEETILNANSYIDGITSDNLIVDEIFKNKNNVPLKPLIIENSVVQNGLNTQSVQLDKEIVNQCSSLIVIIEEYGQAETISFSNYVYVNKDSSVNLFYGLPIYNSINNRVIIPQYNKTTGILKLIAISGEISETTLITKVIGIK